MELSLNQVASRVVIVIIALSALLIAGGFVILESPLPFATGVSLSMAVNVAKVLMLKRTVNRTVNMDALAAKRHMTAQSYLRMVLTIAVLLGSAFLFNEYLDIFGVIIGIFTFPIAFHSMRFFVREDNPEILAKANERKSAAQDAVDEINAIVSENKENNEVG